MKRLNGVHVYVVGGHDDRNDDRVATLQKEGVVDMSCSSPQLPPLSVVAGRRKRRGEASVRRPDTERGGDRNNLPSFC